MLYSFAHMATVGVKGLKTVYNINRDSKIACVRTVAANVAILLHIHRVWFSQSGVWLAVKIHFIQNKKKHLFSLQHGATAISSNYFCIGTTR